MECEAVKLTCLPASGRRRSQKSWKRKSLDEMNEPVISMATVAMKRAEVLDSLGDSESWRVWIADRVRILGSVAITGRPSNRTTVVDDRD